MRALDRKLLRDLWHARGQGIAIAFVVAAGIAMFVGAISTLRSLRAAQEAFYERYRFADVFASVVRAPRDVVDRVRELPGVARAEGGVAVDVTLDVPGLVEPAVGRLVSAPVPRRPTLNDTYIRAGRDLSGGDEVLASEGFASAHGLRPGDMLAAVINGRRRELRIVGIALSPEYIYAVRPGELMPDEARFGVFWMDERAVAAAFDLTGAVNRISLNLRPRASETDVIRRLDRLLAPYGGAGAVGRDRQVSHTYINNELMQLENMGYFAPVLFLAVAAFLLNVALMRTVAVQREQIAALKALGYGDGALALHYAEWGLAIAGAGGAAGVALGAAMGAGMLELYNQYFRFPALDLELDPDVVVGGIAIALGAALAGAAFAVRRALALPPAEAMRPEAPARFRETWIERTGLRRWLSPARRMILRNLVRQPVRAGTAVAGIAAAVSLLVVGMFSLDSIDEIIRVQFFATERQDVTVSFVENAPSRAIYDVASLPGVVAAEPFLGAAVRLRRGHRSRLTSISGLVSRPRLSRVLDVDEGPRPLPPDGLVLAAFLAEQLDAVVGDRVDVELLQGERRTGSVRVAAVVEQWVGAPAYMNIDALRRLAGEGDLVSGAFIDVADADAPALYRALKAAPRVASVSVKRAALDTFNRTLDETLYVLIFFNLFFAGTIAFGVIYNAARVSLSERARELASLRILGFTRAEISAILLGELAVVTAAGIPLGFAAGYGLAVLLSWQFESELFRLPVVISSRTYAFAALGTLGAALVSALAVRRRLDRLDLIAVLKARE
jgi:putative ABC transport system permease protein